MAAAAHPRRTWLFVPGADAAAHRAAQRSGADVLIHELEDFTPPALRSRARALAPTLYAQWRAAGALVAVRINPFETCGREDLAAVLAGKPDIVMMSKVVSPEQVRALARRAGRGVELVPNIETAAGLVRTFDIVRASAQVTAALVASEDMVADLGTVRSRTAEELAYVRSRFLVECRAAGVEAIDCPYTFADARGAAAEARRAKRLGYRAKSLVTPGHARRAQSRVLGGRGRDRAGPAHRRRLRARTRRGPRAGDGRRPARRGADLRGGAPPARRPARLTARIRTAP